MEKWQKKAIAEIMEDFDFVRVENTMKKLKWTWATTKHKVPTIEQLKHHTEEMLIDAIKNHYWTSSYGGFIVFYSEKHRSLQLIFAITTCENTGIE